MKNNKSLLSHAVKAGIVSLALFSAAQAHAESPPVMPLPHELISPTVDELYVKADTNRDGMISAEEHYELHTAAALMKFEMTFKAIDANGDGLVQAEEFVHFLPSVDADMAKQQLLAAAGDDESLDSEEFSVMRLKEQGVNNDSMWEFALLDRDHDGLLVPHEFYVDLPDTIEPPEFIIDPTPIEPPELIIDPTPIEPPELIIDPTPIEPPELIIDPTPIQPPELIIDPTPVQPPELIIDPTPVQPPELIIDPTPVQPPELIIDPTPITLPGAITSPNGSTDALDFVGPPKPVVQPISQEIELDEDHRADLKEKLARTEQKITRLNKSILMTQKRMESVTSDKKLARLERRLKRQMDRIAKLQDLYQMTLKELGEAQ